MKTMGNTWQEWPSKQTEKEPWWFDHTFFFRFSSIYLSFPLSPSHSFNYIFGQMSIKHKEKERENEERTVSQFVLFSVLCMWRWWLTANIVINVSPDNGEETNWKEMRSRKVRCLKDWKNQVRTVNDRVRTVHKESNRGRHRLPRGSFISLFPLLTIRCICHSVLCIPMNGSEFFPA